MTALIIEDDDSEREFLRRGLSELGYSCTIAKNGKDGFLLFQRNPYDLAIVDLLLPGKDGRDIIREARAVGIKTPVIIVSALGSTNDRIAGLNLGADAYLPKPCDMTELKAHINAFNRRFLNTSYCALRAHGITLDTVTRTCTRNGRSILLSDDDPIPCGRDDRQDHLRDLRSGCRRQRRQARLHHPVLTRDHHRPRLSAAAAHRQPPRQRPQEFTPAGGEINVVLSTSASDLNLIVADTGIGMTPEEQSHVFERFYRADKSRHTPGFGLGLTLVHATVAFYRGTISVTSAPTRGTTFTISLPTVETSDFKSDASADYAISPTALTIFTTEYRQLA